MALTHYPVINRNGHIISSAVTNLDLHDLSRSAKTYGVQMFYVVTPLSDQKELIEKIILHWTKGIGSRFNPSRCSALELVNIKDSLDEVKEDIHGRTGVYPKIIVTCAREKYSTFSISEFRKKLQTEVPYLLIFGTAWGLSEELILKADYVLEPVKGYTDYNHLSVRSASAIILDRILGER